MYFLKSQKTHRSLFVASFVIGQTAAVVLGASVGSSSSSGSPTPTVNKQQPAQEVQSSPPVDLPVASRGVKEVQADLRESSSEISAVLSDKPDLKNPIKRAKLAVLIIPLEYRLISLLDELVKLQPNSHSQIDSMRQRAVAMLYLFNDAQIAKTVDVAKANGNRHEVNMACAIQILSQWIINTENPAARDAVAEQLIGLDRANPTEPRLTALTYSLSRETSDKATADKLLKAAISMKNPVAKAVAGQLSASKHPSSTQTPDNR